MEFETARRVLLMASLEEGDATGDVLPFDRRRRATEAAPDPGEAVDESGFTDLEEAFLLARASSLVEKSGNPVGVRRLLGGALLVVLFLLGFLSKNLGPSGVVNVLAFPLLGMMVWNLGVYAISAVRRLIGGGDAKLSERFSEMLDRKPKDEFARRWARITAPVGAAWGRALFHLGAALLAIGAVAAMYWQGLVRDYQATWESTFLSAENVHGLLSVALAPATWLPGLALPDVAGIEAIRAPGGERAAAWIHRYALAAGVVIVLPRLVLATIFGLRARALGNSMSIRGEAPAYFKTLLARKRGTKSVVRVVPHRLELAPKQRDALREALHVHWGGDLWMEFLDSVRYGDEEAFGGHASELVDSDHIAVVCGRGATPEDESQGHLLRAVSAAADGGKVLLVLEDAGFTERFGEARAAERNSAWEKLAAHCDVELLTEKS